MANTSNESLYTYTPTHIAPAIFSALIGLSFIAHTYQIYRYKFWRVTFWMGWGGAVFTAGWILRTISSYHPNNRNLYIAQNCLILGGPPIYAAAEYNILGRIMHYLPMHAPLHPGRVVIFFVYVGAAVESLTAAGAAMRASSKLTDLAAYRRAGTLISISLVLQAAVEVLFISFVAVIHRRCIKARMLSRNVRTLVIMLYGTASLILIRCIFRAIEAFSTETITNPDACTGVCKLVLFHEWYLYVFEALPMLLYTVWLNVIHPGRFLPRVKQRYLDLDAKTERLGPGWVDSRSSFQTFADPFDFSGQMKGKPSHTKFWKKSDEWPVMTDGSFALGTATNAGRILGGKEYRRASVEA